MKTNIRVRRNSGSKPAPAQVPNNPEPVIPANTDSAAAVISYLRLPPLKRVNVIHESGLDMEQAVYRALALLELLARQDCIMTERQKAAGSGGTGSGMMSWSDDLRLALYRDWLAANDAARTADSLAAVRKLNNTVEKVAIMLLMLAHDLSAYGYFADSGVGSEPAEEDIAPLLSLASDCIEYLRASFFDRFGKLLPMDSIDLELCSELMAKFQPKEQRRAA